MSTPSELVKRLEGYAAAAYLGDKAIPTPGLFADLREAADRIAELEAQVARLTMERDRLIESWPESWTSCVSRFVNQGTYIWHRENDPRGYPTKAAAVRAKAGLDEKGVTT